MWVDGKLQPLSLLVDGKEPGMQREAEARKSLLGLWNILEHSGNPSPRHSEHCSSWKHPRGHKDPSFPQGAPHLVPPLPGLARLSTRWHSWALLGTKTPQGFP